MRQSAHRGPWQMWAVRWTAWHRKDHGSPCWDWGLNRRMDRRQCRPRRIRFRISEQNRHSKCAIHAALDQQRVGLGEELRVMFEVFAGCLKCVHHVVG